jgi:hypothetical protein
VLAPPRPRYALELQDEFDIRPRRPPRQQVCLLEYETTITPRTGDRPSIDADVSCIPVNEPLHDAQQGGLAATALSNERYNLVLVDVEAYPAKHRQKVVIAVLAAPHAEGLRHVLDRQLDVLGCHGEPSRLALDVSGQETSCRIVKQLVDLEAVRNEALFERPVDGELDRIPTANGGIVWSASGGAAFRLSTSMRNNS